MAAVLIVACVAVCRSFSDTCRVNVMTVTDTIRRDTVIYNIRVVDSTIVRYSYKTVTEVDTITRGGNLLVKIPVRKYTFDVPEFGMIYASGYDVSIDSTAFTTTTIVTRKSDRKVKFNLSVGCEVAYSIKFTPSVYAECGITVKGRFNVYAGASVFYDDIVNGGVYAGINYVIR